MQQWMQAMELLQRPEPKNAIQDFALEIQEQGKRHGAWPLGSQCRLQSIEHLRDLIQVHLLHQFNHALMHVSLWQVISMSFALA
jgi:hypothetical protein